MMALLRLVWSLCLLKASPSDMPHSVLLLMIFVILEFLLASFQLTFFLGFEIAITQASVLIGVLVAYIYSVLLTGSKASRFVQTATSLLAVNVLLDCLHMPVLIINEHITATGQPTLGLILFSVIVFIYIIALNIWLIMITSHVFARALDAAFSTGLLVTVAMLALNVVSVAFLQHYS